MMEEQQKTEKSSEISSTVNEPKHPKHDYWTEPVKEDHKWRSYKLGPDGKKLGSAEFGNKGELVLFLTEISVYVDGNLCYKGQ